MQWQTTLQFRRLGKSRKRRSKTLKMNNTDLKMKRKDWERLLKLQTQEHGIISRRGLLKLRLRSGLYALILLVRTENSLKKTED